MRCPAARFSSGSRCKADRDLDWEEISQARRRLAGLNWTSDRPAVHPLHIRHHRRPKGIVRDQRRARCCHEIQHDGDLRRSKPGEVFWAASDVGWVVGHSYIVYAPLIQGCTTVLYEGKPVRTPDAGAFGASWPTTMCESCSRPQRRSGRSSERTRQGEWAKQYDTSGLRYLFLAGERCDVATLRWAAASVEGARDRPLVANGIGLADGGEFDWASNCCRSNRARCQAGLRLRSARARCGRTRSSAGPGRVDCDSFAVAARLPDESVEKPGSFPATPISDHYPGYYLPATVAIRTTTATSLSRAASTTSLTWRAIGFPRPPWRRSSLRIRLWRSAP